MGLRISPAGLFLYFSLLMIIMKLLIFSLPVNPSIPSLKERKDPSKAVLPGFLTFLGIFLLCRKHVLKSPFGISAQFIQPICQSVAGLIIYMMLHPVWISRLLKDLHHPRYCLFGRPSVIITHTQKQHICVHILNFYPGLFTYRIMIIAISHESSKSVLFILYGSHENPWKSFIDQSPWRIRHVLSMPCVYGSSKSLKAVRCPLHNIIKGHDRHNTAYLGNERGRKQGISGSSRCSRHCYALYFLFILQPMNGSFSIIDRNGNKLIRQSFPHIKAKYKYIVAGIPQKPAHCNT